MTCKNVWHDKPLRCKATEFARMCSIFFGSLLLAIYPVVRCTCLQGIQTLPPAKGICVALLTNVFIISLWLIFQAICSLFTARSGVLL